MNFFQGLFSTIIKWWNVHIIQAFQLDNNEPGKNKPMTRSRMREEEEAKKAAEEATGADEEETSMHMSSADAMEILNRINREKTEAHLQEIEEGRRKAKENGSGESSSADDEQARIQAILNSNKVDISGFIEEGREQAEKEQENAPEEQAETAASSATDEQLRRAQEIMERLNREAAEDEAKKQAEIDAAKAQAGVL